MDSDYLPHSPFRQWLAMNYAPTSSQIEQIRAFLQRPIEDLSILESQIVEAERHLSDLKARHKKLQQTINMHQAMLHPIRQLPGEIVGEIFIRCLPTIHLPVMTTSQAPILLTHVCRSWRSLALSTPSLWSSLHIATPRGISESAHRSVTQTRLACLQWWLLNSRGSSLNLSLYSPQALRYTYGVGTQFPTTILFYSRRLRFLELQVPHEMLLIVINVPVEFPLLEKVVVRFKDGRSRALGGSVRTANIWRAPILRRVVWESVNAEFFWLPVDWSSMEEIDISGNEVDKYSSSFSHRDARCLVRATPFLQRLRIELTGDLTKHKARHKLGVIPEEPEGPDNAAFLAYHPIRLSHLTTLDLADVFLDPDIACTFTENLQLPALTTLKYRLMKDSTNIPYANGHPLLWFLRSQEQWPIQLQNLTVDATSISREDFIDCLQLLPLLKRLWVKDAREIPIHTTWDEDDEELEREEEEDKIWSGCVVGTEVAPDDSILEALQPSFPVVGTSKAIAGPNRLEYVRFDRSKFTLQALQKFVKLRSSTQAHDSGHSPSSRRGFLQHIHVGLMYPRPDAEAEKFERQCLEHAIKITLKFAQRREGRGYASHLGITNLADEGVRILDDEL